jgi:predicted transcriptional regulator
MVYLMGRMTMRTIDRILRYIKDNPDCTVSEIERGADVEDVAATWVMLIDLERADLITQRRDAGGKWYFTAS